MVTHETLIKERQVYIADLLATQDDVAKRLRDTLPTLLAYGLTKEANQIQICIEMLEGLDVDDIGEVSTPNGER